MLSSGVHLSLSGAGRLSPGSRNEPKAKGKKDVPCGDRKRPHRPGQTTSAQTAGPAPGIRSSWARPRLLVYDAEPSPALPGEKYHLPQKPLGSPSRSLAGGTGLALQPPCEMSPGARTAYGKKASPSLNMSHVWALVTCKNALMRVNISVSPPMTPLPQPSFH